MESIERLANGPVETLRIPRCGHAPHVEQRDVVLAAMARFIRRVADTDEG